MKPEGPLQFSQDQATFPCPKQYELSPPYPNLPYFFNIYFNTFAASYLTLNLLTTTIVAPPVNASKWQMGFNSAFKGLNTQGLNNSCLKSRQRRP